MTILASDSRQRRDCNRLDEDRGGSQLTCLPAFVETFSVAIPTPYVLPCLLSRAKFKDCSTKRSINLSRGKPTRAFFFKRSALIRSPFHACFASPSHLLSPSAASTQVRANPPPFISKLGPKDWAWMADGLAGIVCTSQLVINLSGLECPMRVSSLPLLSARVNPMFDGQPQRASTQPTLFLLPSLSQRRGRRGA